MDDPRAGGDDYRASAVGLSGYGRSPRWRGRPPVRGHIEHVLGTIPALAGTTSHGGSDSSSPPDDPRAGGDDEVPLSNEGRRIGRSPRWRGRRHPTDGLKGMFRTIPALAGTTGRDGVATQRGKDDTRAGGDDSSRAPGEGSASGRSPRWRGRLGYVDRVSVAARTIPALAGTTWGRLWSRSQRSDDPRAGGDDLSSFVAYPQTIGRSPRWRGRPLGCVGGGDSGRTIPALAGTTSSARSSWSAPQDDPRAGGDDPTRTGRGGSGWGRSPRWRGRPCRRRRARRVRRTIPALAGTTRCRSSPVTMTADDPRAGGDDTSSSLRVRTPFGRSPRWRGRHQLGRRGQVAKGTIPALAGTTWTTA